MDDPRTSSGSTPGKLTFDQALGEVIRKERTYRGYSLEELGAGMINPDLLSRIESGWESVDPGELVFIAARLGTHVNNLLDQVGRLLNPPVPIQVVGEEKLTPEKESEVLNDEDCVVLELVSRGWSPQEIALSRGYKSAASTTTKLGHIRRWLKLPWHIRDDKLVAWLNEAKVKDTPLGKRLKKIGETVGERPIGQLDQREVEISPGVAQRITDLRYARKLRQSDVAEAIFRSPYWVCSLEGVRNSSAPVRIFQGELDKLAGTLDISPEELLNGGPLVDEILTRARETSPEVVKVPVTKELGERIRNLRYAGGLSQKSLVKGLPFTATVVSQIETDSVGNTSLRHIELLANRLEVPPQELLEGGPTVDKIIADWRKSEEQEADSVTQELVYVDQEIVRRIRRLRDVRGLPQKAIAEVTGHSAPWASSLEGILHTIPSGFARQYRYDEIKKIADLLEVPILVLLDEDGSACYSLLENLEERQRAENQARFQAWQKQQREEKEERERSRRERQAAREAEQNRRREKAERRARDREQHRQKRGKPALEKEQSAEKPVGYTPLQLQILVFISRGWNPYQIVSYLKQRPGGVFSTYRALKRRPEFRLLSDQELGEWVTRSVETGTSKLSQELRRVNEELAGAAQPVLAEDRHKEEERADQKVEREPEEEEDSVSGIYIPQPIVKDQVGLSTGLRELVQAIPTPNFFASRGPWITRYGELKRAVKLTFIRVVRKRNLGNAARRNIFYLGRLIWELPEAADFVDDFDQAMKRLQSDRVAIERQVRDVLAVVAKEGAGGK